jgi:Coenzyme PQQ synthesis protein D (PqqD)
MGSMLGREAGGRMLNHDTNVDEAARPAQRAGVTLERVGAEAILVDHAAGRAHVVNGSAARLWELLGAARDRESLIVAYAAAYALPADAVRASAERALDVFAALGLLD